MTDWALYTSQVYSWIFHLQWQKALTKETASSLSYWGGSFCSHQSCIREKIAVTPALVDGIRDLGKHPRDIRKAPASGFLVWTPCEPLSSDPWGLCYEPGSSQCCWCMPTSDWVCSWPRHPHKLRNLGVLFVHLQVPLSSALFSFLCLLTKK